MRPILEMFWVVEYRDGSVVSQIDPTLQRENPYSVVNHKRAARYWWLPVPPQLRMQGFRHNPLLHRQGVEARGAHGFVARRTALELELGRRHETAAEKALRLLLHPPVRVACYIVGIDGGPRVELYPDGTVLRLNEPRSNGETQGVLR